MILLIGEWGKGVPFKPKIWQKPEEKQGKFYYNTSNDELLDVGCCLISSVSCLIGFTLLKQRNSTGIQAESLVNQSFWNRFSFKMGYEGGLAYAGEVLSKPTDFAFIPDISSWFYWLNSGSVSILYSIKIYPRRMELGIKVKYLWTMLEDRVSNILDRTTQPWEEPWVPTSGREWQIDGISISGLFRSEIRTNYFYQFGAIGYMAKGIDKEKFFRYVTTAEYKTVTVEVSNIGWGMLISVGRIYKISPKFGLEILSNFEFSITTETSHTLPEGMIWKRKANFDFSGLYLGVQIFYKGG
ncbi:MAG TPA: hypothetical protein EYP60_03635 [bacterium (Candidatus Stahlbacteria)]|nr:hypothetical protein [Candidatus Stahlbacteria bacterium]